MYFRIKFWLAPSNNSCFVDNLFCPSIILGKIGFSIRKKDNVFGKVIAVFRNPETGIMIYIFESDLFWRMTNV